MLGRVRDNGHQSDYFETMNIIPIRIGLLNKDVVLDGEICVFENGISHLNLLMRKENQLRAVYVIFDILWLDGKDLSKLPYFERIEILKEWYKKTLIPNDKSPIRILDFINYSEPLIKKMYEAGLEGIVAKKLNSQYLIDWGNPCEEMRTPLWLKFKFWKTTDVKIKGLKPSEHNSHGALITEKGDVGLLTMANLEYYKNNKPEYAKVRFLEMSEKGKMRKPTLLGFKVLKSQSIGNVK